jgi:hypothetical protein
MKMLKTKDGTEIKEGLIVWVCPTLAVSIEEIADYHVKEHKIAQICDNEAIEAKEKVKKGWERWGVHFGPEEFFAKKKNMIIARKKKIDGMIKRRKAVSARQREKINKEVSHLQQVKKGLTEN